MECRCRRFPFSQKRKPYWRGDISSKSSVSTSTKRRQTRRCKTSRTSWKHIFYRLLTVIPPPRNRHRTRTGPGGWELRRSPAAAGLPSFMMTDPVAPSGVPGSDADPPCRRFLTGSEDGAVAVVDMPPNKRAVRIPASKIGKHASLYAICMQRASAVTRSPRVPSSLNFMEINLLSPA